QRQQITADAWKILPNQRRARGTKITPKQRSVKSMTPVLLPILCSAVACRVKNNFYLLLTAMTLDENGRHARIKCGTGILAVGRARRLASRMTRGQRMPVHLQARKPDHEKYR